MFWFGSRDSVAIFMLLSVGGMMFCSHAFDCDEKLVFRLYTPSNRIDPQELDTHHGASLTISETNFDARRPTRIFIHGYNSHEKLIADFRDAYLMFGNFNFIAVDWIAKACTYNYLVAKEQVPYIGMKLAFLLITLASDHGLNLKDVTIVGHSLGAHIAGRTGKLLKSNNKIGCIIGLDPAGVGFSHSNPRDRLATTDADYVQVIHTDIEKFGLKQPIGHADFYPNSGKDQPGCKYQNKVASWIDCSHGRSHEFFLEGLSSRTSEFMAARCGSLEEIQKRVCKCDNTFEYMGGDITRDTPKPYGVFYLETKGEPPFVIPDPLFFHKVKIVPRYY